MPENKITFRPMTRGDWPRVAAIFKEGIETHNATYDRDIPSWEQWNADHFPQCRIIVDVNGEIAGWAALLPISNRYVFRGVAELSIYLSCKFINRQIGRRLLAHIIDESEKAGFWMLQSGIFPENKASLRIHEKTGFRLVGRRERIGKMDGIWRDIVLLERRSKITGYE